MSDVDTKTLGMVVIFAPMFPLVVERLGRI
jgi:hypothetical protein